MLAVGMLLVLSMLSGCGAKKDGPMDQVQEKVSNVEVENPQTGTMKMNTSIQVLLNLRIQLMLQRL